MQAIQVLIVASKDLQREIVESGRVSVGEGPWKERTDISYRSPAHWETKPTNMLIHIQWNPCMLPCHPACPSEGAAATPVDISRCHGKKLEYCQVPRECQARAFNSRLINPGQTLLEPTVETQCALQVWAFGGRSEGFWKLSHLEEQTWCWLFTVGSAMSLSKSSQLTVIHRQILP